jgi:hypothetical protein
MVCWVRAELLHFLALRGYDLGLDHGDYLQAVD